MLLQNVVVVVVKIIVHVRIVQTGSGNRKGSFPRIFSKQFAAAVAVVFLFTI